MKKIQTRTLSFKLWSYFALFAAAIMIILWLLQIVFLNTFYNNIKTKQIVNIGRQIAKEYGSNDFQQTIDELSYRNSLVTLVINTSGHIIAVSQIDSFERAPLSSSIDNFNLFFNKLSLDPEGEISYTYENKRFKSQTILYGKILEHRDHDDVILYLSMPLEPVASAVFVLQRQLVYVIIAVLILSFFISFFISRRISKPIIHISNSAKLLGTGDYSVVFEKSNYAEIDELATTLNYATRELSGIDQLRRELIANISHDLRTPLTIIKSYAEMIKDISGENPEKRNIHAKVIIDETDRLTGLVNDILVLSNLEAKGTKAIMHHIDFSTLVQSILERFELLCQSMGYSIDTHIESNLFILADKGKIEQVVYNLISNAVNYTGEDKKIVVVVTKKANKAHFEVSDTGPGISKEDLPLIWDRYYKCGQTYKRFVVGTGLGLSIVKNILQMHNAAFGVNTQINKGSTFWFQLPISNL